MSSTSSKIIKIFLISIACLLASIAAISYYVVRKATYRMSLSPERQACYDALRADLIEHHGAEQVEFKSYDNLTLRGLLLVRPHAKRVILLCHGYRLTKEHMIQFVPLFPNDTIFLFDFRAHGQSDGSIVTIGCNEQYDVQAAVKFLHANAATKNLPIIGLGISMGGASLVGAAAHGTQFKALIIDSSFANLLDQVSHSFEEKTGFPKIIFLPSVMLLFRYLAGCNPALMVPARYIQDIHCPIFLIHSLTDTMTPASNVYRLYAGARDKKLWLIDQAKHGCALWEMPEEYKKNLQEFLAAIE